MSKRSFEANDDEIAAEPPTKRRRSEVNCTKNKENNKFCTELSQKNNYKLSLQIHKILEIE